jgi:hypothetical protein
MRPIEGGTMNRKRVGIALLLAALAVLVWFSARLAATRIYQVDECQNLYMARILATGQASQFFTTASLFLIGPLSWISRSAEQSAEAFAAARLLFLGIFWLNLLLLASIASGRLCSIRGLGTLVAASTLAPLWDYGFEVRHDNLILTSILLIWWTIRAKPMGALSYMFAGGVAVAALFIAVKALVYVIPLSFVILVFPSPAHRRSRWQLGLAWLAGALLATGIIRLCYWTGGKWELYLSVFHGVTKYSASGAGGNARFWPWGTLSRLLGQTPLVLAMTTAACFAVAAELWRRGRAGLNWDGILPEVLLLAVAFGGLMANPTPYPYNVLHVAPYAFLLASRYGTVIWKQVQDSPRLWPFTASVIIFAHLAPFGYAVQRHLNYSNSRQTILMSLAENLTDAAKDPVYDGIGLVPTRPTIHFQWYLHSLNLQLVKEPGHRVRDMLGARPAAVFIPSYRTDWLSEEDHAFVRERYVAVADDFRVLGKVLPAGGGTFEIFHPGRYRISSFQGSDLAAEGSGSSGRIPALSDEASFTVTLDGAPVSSLPVELTVGIHRIESKSDCQPAVVWVGPKRDRIGPLRQSDHRSLFVNWY